MGMAVVCSHQSGSFAMVLASGRTSNHTGRVPVATPRAWGPGELCNEDHATNVWAIANGARLLSSYPLPTGELISIITKDDRSSTCLLLPTDY